MKKLTDLTGYVFGRWVVLSPSHKDKHGGWYWNCRCSCGNVKIVNGGNLKTGKTLSCGCYHTEMMRGPGSPTFKHGLSHDYLGRIRDNMLTRCYNKKVAGYKDYGGRGITVHQEWIDNPQSFYTWALNSGFMGGLTIDRIDNNKGYSPENCRWATVKEQANNKRNNIFVSIFNVSSSLKDICNIIGANYKKVHKRCTSSGWPVSWALLIPEYRDISRDKRIAKAYALEHKRLLSLRY
jgi:hypothetical protein